jgi:hypothetical protein
LLYEHTLLHHHAIAVLRKQQGREGERNSKKEKGRSGVEGNHCNTPLSISFYSTQEEEYNRYISSLSATPLLERSL